MRQGCALNIILIGMPGAGKSTVGVLLAKRLGYNFIDTDLLLQIQHQCRLQDIIAQFGLERFKEFEANVLSEIETSYCVIATGGSAVYSANAMNHLKKIGQVVFIDIPLNELLRRVNDMDTRGIVIGPGESFEKLYGERQPLYQKYAEIKIPATGLTVQEVAAAIEERVCSKS